MPRSPYAPCPECRRHVRVAELRCPFCDRDLASSDLRGDELPDQRFGRAAQLAWKLTLGGVGAVACASGGGPTNVAPPPAPSREATEVRAPPEAPTADAGPEADAPDALPRNVIAIYSATAIKITKSVTFPPYSANVVAAQAPTLDAIAELLAKYPKMQVEIQGHSDEGESPKFAEARAQAVRAELVRRGVAAERLTVKSLGKDWPTAPPPNPANRRVQFQILSGGDP